MYMSSMNLMQKAAAMRFILNTVLPLLAQMKCNCHEFHPICLHWVFTGYMEVNRFPLSFMCRPSLPLGVVSRAQELGKTNVPTLEAGDVIEADIWKSRLGGKQVNKLFLRLVMLVSLLLAVLAVITVVVWFPFSAKIHDCNVSRFFP